MKWLRRDFGGRLPSEVFREHLMACYVTDKTSLKLRHEIGINQITWENVSRFLNWAPPPQSPARNGPTSTPNEPPEHP
jgi:hypothetical protein